MKKIVLLFLVLISTLQLGWSQDYLPLVTSYIQQNYKVSTQPTDWKVMDQVKGQQGITYLYLRQVFEGIEIYNSALSIAIQNNKIVNFQGEFFKNNPLTSKGLSTISEEEAIKKAAQQLNIKVPVNFKAAKLSYKGKGLFSEYNYYTALDVFKETVPIKKMYFRQENNSLVEIWHMVLYEPDGAHWWEVALNGQNGEILQKADWIQHCRFDIPSNTSKESKSIFYEEVNFSPPIQAGSYHVFAPPLESPNHGNRTLVNNPSDSLASPYGWHDINGDDPGEEYTLTRGNNAHVYEDYFNLNIELSGTSPNGGPSLNFDFPYNNLKQPQSNRDATLVNIFFWTNYLHDIFYHNGFDEAAGNFQVNNYNRGGQGNDEVLVEWLNGAQRNNSQFATPPDGSKPRMELYLWNQNLALPKDLTITAPNNLAGIYTNTRADFGPSLSSPALSGRMMFVETSVFCGNITQNLNDRIAVVRYSVFCPDVLRVKELQNQGAKAVVIVSDKEDIEPVLGNDPSITIPTILIKKSDGDRIIQALRQGRRTEATLQLDATTTGLYKDSGLDNGIIAHEYGHGISMRLTGGPSNSSCLSNAEQMGEGWSDYFALLLTMAPDDTRQKRRTIGTYVLSQPTNGRGLRRVPYTTDFAVNNLNYRNLKTFSSPITPDDVGLVWATMLWDMTWEFIDRYGFDQDLIKGKGGNRKALEIVIEALKLQPCNPGFVDARNAILKADSLLSNAENQDLIWSAFARRGLGFSAKQGSSNNISDGKDTTDLPLFCFAKASKFLIPDTTSFGWPLTLQPKEDLPAFSINYTTSLREYEFFYILTRNDTIIAYNPRGDFDFSILPSGKYIVWGLSIQTKDLNTLRERFNIWDYLGAKKLISDLQQESATQCMQLNNQFIDGSLAEITIESLLPTSLSTWKKIKANVYPNPNTGNFIIEFDKSLKSKAIIKIYNMQGQEVLEALLAPFTKKEQFSLRNFGKGIYLVRIISEDNSLMEGKIIVQ